MSSKLKANLSTKPPTERDLAMLAMLRDGARWQDIGDRFDMAAQSAQAAITRLAAARWITVDFRVYTTDQRDRLLKHEADVKDLPDVDWRGTIDPCD